MKIGEDFDKMEFSMFGLDLLEPNSLISDSLITIVALFFAYKVSKKFPLNQPFYNYWKWLFILQGISFFLGGLGHVLYNYTGVWGKYFPLATAVGFIMVIEHAVICLLPQENRKIYFNLSKTKAFLALTILTVMMFTMDVENNLSTLLLVPSANTAVGYILTLGVIGFIYARKKSKALYLLPLSVLTLIPAAIFQAQKISFHPWFDRNDVSHLLIISTFFMYYFAIKGYYRDTKDLSKS